MSGIPNYDVESGIHFGFIYQNDVDSQMVSDEIIQHGTDLGYENAMAEAKDAIMHEVYRINDAITEFNEAIAEALVEIREKVGGWSEEERSDFIEDHDLKLGGTLDPDAIWEELEQSWSDSVDSMESGPYLYERDGYIIRTTDDNGLFIVKSPYYTLCRECSPCAPNAGYLRSQPGSMKTYCLGSEWFDEYSPLPYTVYSVATDEIIEKWEGHEDEETA